MACYLDNSATTAVCPAAADKAFCVMTDVFGNPSSLHTLGVRAEEELTAARRAVASLLGLPDDAAAERTIVFTSGGTEANNLALLGGADAMRRRGKHIVTTAIEHPSVLEAAKELERQGFSVTFVPPDANGDIAAKAIADACREDTVLVSVMTVNNETGARLPINAISTLVRRTCPHALIHTDAVQAAGKLSLKPIVPHVDLISISGHKLHAPKGVGALYIRPGVRLTPRVFGGGQERGMRSGTESVPLIAAVGAAIGQLPSYQAQEERYRALEAQLLDGLKTVDGVTCHLPANKVPYIVNVSVAGLKSETLVHFLAARDIYVSAGSACAKGHESHVLQAMGLPKEAIGSALRISLSSQNTSDDIHTLITALRDAVNTLARADNHRKGGI
ncbi:MAG: cysteine desulfurase [Clostridia bacterium]|nr:cysteine desulfurase [Clostridia bacterium]